MTAAAPPAPGTIGVVSTLHASSWLDRTVARAIQFDTGSPVNHAFVYAGQRRILEARPGGSRLSPWDTHPGTIWLTAIAPPPQPYSALQAVAGGLLGVPYNWLDIAAIGIAQRRFDPDRYREWVEAGRDPWWVRRVSRPDRLICSQLADLYYLRLGRHLFADRRLTGLVSPGDLYRLNQSLAA